jgi:hypothetical protein
MSSYRDPLKIVVSPVRVRVSPLARGEGIHARDRGRRPDRFESGSRHHVAVKASMPVTGDAIQTGSSPGLEHQIDSSSADPRRP